MYKGHFWLWKQQNCFSSKSTYLLVNCCLVKMELSTSTSSTIDEKSYTYSESWKVSYSCWVTAADENCVIQSNTSVQAASGSWDETVLSAISMKLQMISFSLWRSNRNIKAVLYLQELCTRRIQLLWNSDLIHFSEEGGRDVSSPELKSQSAASSEEGWRDWPLIQEAKFCLCAMAKRK